MRAIPGYEQAFALWLAEPWRAFTRGALMPAEVRTTTGPGGDLRATARPSEAERRLGEALMAIAQNCPLEVFSEASRRMLRDAQQEAKASPYRQSVG
ncbi:MAG: hypothetical protein E7K72_16370 [Roseomonas mucosa]|nr:hypothetical protein [Roseomonas mucosa]